MPEAGVIVTWANRLNPRILNQRFWALCTSLNTKERMLEYLKYRVVNGTIADLRERVYRLLKACQVEMIALIAKLWRIPPPFRRSMC